MNANAPNPAADQPYLEEHGSVAQEMVMRLSHAHPLYRVDNAVGYSELVTATYGTQYAPTIAPFKRTKDGRGALIALKAQFAGPAYWDKEVRQMNDFLNNTKWFGTTAFTLHGFLAKHRSCYNTLQRCAEHVTVELPSERTRVGYLLENIDCQDKDVTTALSHIRLDDGANGMRGDFERSVAFLLPTDPVKRKQKGAKRTSAQISATDATESEDSNKKRVSFKPNVGKTGVELRYYKSKEYNKLSQEQKDELKAHRLANGGYKNSWTKKSKGGGKGKSGSKLTKADVSAMIKENEQNRNKAAEEHDAMKQALADEMKEMVATQVAATLATMTGQKRGLQRAGASSNVGSVNVDPAEASAAAADRAAASLMEKWNSMGSKAGKAAKSNAT